MSTPGILTQVRQHFTVGASLVGLFANLGTPLPAAAQSPKTATPIQHVIVIIGENRTFDHVFATYKPVAGQTVSNLLYKGIVNADGTPGPNFALARQSQATDSKPSKYLLNPPDSVTYNVLPPVLAGGYTTPPFATIADAMAVTRVTTLPVPALPSVMPCCDNTPVMLTMAISTPAAEVRGG